MIKSSKKITVGKHAFVRWLVTIYAFCLTLYIAPYYIGGDQKWYTEVYTNLAHLNLLPGYIYYHNTVGGVEIIHYLLIYLTSWMGIEKNIVMAVSNALLAYFSIRLFEKWKTSMLMAAAIMLTNYYAMVLYFAAERLKFGFLFLVFSLLYLERKKLFITNAILAVFSHVQIILVYGSMFFGKVFHALVRILVTLKFNSKAIIYLVISLVPFVLLGNYILLKTIYYMKIAADRSIFDAMNMVIFLGLALWYSKNKTEPFFQFVPLIILVLILGSDRINILGYFLFLYYGLRYKGGMNFGVLVTTVYFAIKSFWFVGSIFQYGYGYGS